MLENLKNSELPQQVYDYLALINKIVECASQQLFVRYIFNNVQEFLENYTNEYIYPLNKVYDLEIPFESYLRAQYTQLYSQSLYRIDERNQIYGPKDSISNEINYNGKRVLLPYHKDFILKLDLQKIQKSKPVLQKKRK